MSAEQPEKGCSFGRAAAGDAPRPTLAAVIAKLGWLSRTLAGNALSPARFHHLPPNRVVELGTQIAI